MRSSAAIAQKVAGVMTQYAQQNGYTLILDAGSQQQQQSPILWAAESTNISEAVLQAYNKQSGVPAPPPGTAPPARLQPPPGPPRRVQPRPRTTTHAALSGLRRAPSSRFRSPLPHRCLTPRTPARVWKILWIARPVPRGQLRACTENAAWRIVSS